MKRNKNSVVRAFEEAFTAFLATHGVVPLRSLSWHEATPEFKIQTAAGDYTFHYSPQLGERPCNFISVFGRFDNAAEARKLVDCNPFTGKWNFEGLGHIPDEDQARAHANSIARHILKLRVA